MRHLSAFVLGVVATVVVVGSGLVAVGVVAQAQETTVDVGVGPLLLLAVEGGSGASSTTLGSGLALLAVVGGAVNLIATAILERRADRRTGG